MKSNFLNLNFKDILKGLLTAIITAISAYIYEAIQSGNLTAIDWKFVGSTALIAAIGYLTKNLLTNSEGTPLKTESETGYKP